MGCISAYRASLFQPNLIAPFGIRVRIGGLSSLAWTFWKKLQTFCLCLRFILFCSPCFLHLFLIEVASGWKMQTTILCFSTCLIWVFADTECVCSYSRAPTLPLFDRFWKRLQISDHKASCKGGPEAFSLRLHSKLIRGIWGSTAGLWRIASYGSLAWHNPVCDVSQVLQFTEFHRGLMPLFAIGWPMLRSWEGFELCSRLHFSYTWFSAEGPLDKELRMQKTCKVSLAECSYTICLWWIS